MELLTLSCFILIGTLIQRVAGFGMPMIVIPSLLIYFQPTVAVSIALFLGIISSIIVLISLKNIEKIIWKIIFAILPISLLGIITGSYILTIIDKAILQIILGTVIIITLNIQEFFSAKNRQALAIDKPLYTSGAIAGFFNSTVGLSAAPMIIWMRTHAITSNQIRKVFALQFICMNIVSIISIFYFEPATFTGLNFGLLALALPIILIANYIGGIISDRINHNTYERVVYIALSVAGLACLIYGVMSL
ncbi:MAG TPA: sulfite exporter TauE/SafE family protein [Candidatus Saccharimonadales bacterium]|nr:sulfite exporter TauE/SafE family protein [Candidatus Saccharimonadales bacterium]